MAPRSARVGHVNTDGNMRGLRLLANRDRNLMAFGGCEMDRVMDDFPKGGIRGFEHFFGGEGNPDRRALDTAVFRRRSTTVHRGWMGALLSEESTPEKVAGLPRFISGSLFFSEELEMDIAFWELHNHWIGPAHDNPDADRVRETDQGMHRLHRLLAGVEGMGYANIVVGDFNVPPNVSTPGWFSPWEVMQRLDYRLVPGRRKNAKGLRIDGAGVSKRLRIPEVEVLSKEEVRSDHPGFIMEVTPA